MGSAHPETILRPTISRFVSVNSGVVQQTHSLLSLGKPKSLEGPSQEPGTEGQPNSVFHYRIVFHYECPEMRGCSPHRPMLGVPGSHREMKSNNVLGWLLPCLALHGGLKEVVEYSCCTSSLEPFQWLPTNDDLSLYYPAPSFCFPLMPALPWCWLFLLPHVFFPHTFRELASHHPGLNPGVSFLERPSRTSPMSPNHITLFCCLCGTFLKFIIIYWVSLYFCFPPLTYEPC